MYDSVSGIFTWRVPPSYTIEAGEIAGGKTVAGYWRIKIDQSTYYAHRLAWLYQHGYLPENPLDHIDRNKVNNSINNLREVSVQCNIRNVGNKVTNTSGVRGVCWNKWENKWMAAIKVRGTSFHLGYHHCLLEAACHRLAAEQAEDWAGCYNSSPAYQYVNANIKGD